jgi:hypothetical protein
MGQQLMDSFADASSRLVAFVPTLLGGVLVVCVGVLAAWLTSHFVTRLLLVTRVDRVVQRLRWGHALEKGDVRHTLLTFVGGLVGFLVFLVFLQNAFMLWGLTVFSQLVERFVVGIPELAIAGVILTVGFAVASGVGRSVRRALYEEEFERAALISRIVRAALMVLATAMALLQLRVAPTLVSQAFLITFGSIALTAALAFGLGSRRAVELMWEEHFGRRAGTHRKAADEEDEAE